jgi:putative ABC transport system permease protein
VVDGRHAAGHNAITHRRDETRADMMLAFTLARRELRGGVRGLWIVLLCLALGVGVIASVGTLRAAVDAGLASDGRALLGGDLEIDGGSQPLPGSLTDWLHARGATTSGVTQMRSMLVAPSTERQLIELKAVDAAWPLVGTATAQPAQPTQPACGRYRPAGHRQLSRSRCPDARAGSRGDRLDPWPEGVDLR